MQRHVKSFNGLKQNERRHNTRNVQHGNRNKEKRGNGSSNKNPDRENLILRIAGRPTMEVHIIGLLHVLDVTNKVTLFGLHD